MDQGLLLGHFGKGIFVQKKKKKKSWREPYGNKYRALQFSADFIGWSQSEMKKKGSPLMQYNLSASCSM